MGWRHVRIDKTARLIIRLLLGFTSDAVFVKLNRNISKYYNGNAVYVRMTKDLGFNV